ncbi:MAG: S8 family serine peptidase [Candidatus Heimdallarchaeota archaeon]
MKNVKRRISFIGFVAFLVLFAFPVAGGNPFRNVSSTAGGYSTWDSDMINIEAVDETGAGVYVAVLDTGLAPNWRDYFPENRIATDLGIGFYEELHWDPKIKDFLETGNMHTTNFIGSVSSTHGTHVTSTILGYFYRANFDAASGYPLPAFMVRGIAPEVTVIPVKVLADYQLPAYTDEFGDFHTAETVNFGTTNMVAAGIDYISDLAESNPGNKYVISMSLGGSSLEPEEKAAIDRAISLGVIVVAAAGNEGTDGMSFPGAYAPVISVGASGWTKEWLLPSGDPFYRMWWLQSDLLPWVDISEPTPTDEVYVTDFSSRELPGQELDVLAPGSWVRGPFPGFPGYSHIPWWSSGIGDLAGWNPGNFYYLGGTSMATPHVSAVAAMMLERNPTLFQGDIESILKGTALPIPPGFANVFLVGPQAWGADATGSGLVQADAAIAAA